MVYLNGKFLPLAEAHVPVLDRGFIFGDGVYEVIPVYSRHPFRLAEHLVRLQGSLVGVRIENPYDTAAWSSLINELIAANPCDDQSVYLQVTRGVAPRDHAFPAGVAPSVFLMANPLTTPAATLRERGVAAITAEDNRWLRCDIKAISLLPNVLMRQLAIDHGAAETIMLRDGMLTEGSASNIFIVHAGTLLTPPKSTLMLPGITYDVVLELASAGAVPHEVRQITEGELREADEVWLTSSTKEVLPVTRLDHAPVGDGEPGPCFRKMYGLYQDFKARVMHQPA